MLTQESAYWQKSEHLYSQGTYFWYIFNKVEDHGNL